MPAPIYWKKKVLLAAIEATYGIDAGPTGAANAILASEVRLMPMEGSEVDRDLATPWLGGSGSLTTELHAKISFKVELAPSGAAGTAPAWGVLLRGCGCAETIAAGVSVTYNPVSADHEALTLHLHIDGTRYVILGARGNAKFDVSAQGIPSIEFEFTGLFTQPTDQALPTPTLTGWKEPQTASNANTPAFSIDGTDFVLRKFGMDLGNSVENRFLIGAEAVVITDRSETIEATVEAQPIADFNPYAAAAAASKLPVALTHGTGAGKIATLTAPTAQMQRVSGLENAQNVKEWPLRLTPIPASGNDQWTLVLT